MRYVIPAFALHSSNNYIAAYTFLVFFHQVGHNYGHPHHLSGGYDWRIPNKIAYDGWDMMSVRAIIICEGVTDHYQTSFSGWERILHFRFHSSSKVSLQLDPCRIGGDYAA